MPVAEFCAECLESTLAQVFFADSKECTECLSNVYFRAHIAQEVADEIQSLHNTLQLEYGPLALVYAAAGLVKLEYVDVDLKPMSIEDVLERIAEGIRGKEGYAYDRGEIIRVVKAIERAAEAEEFISKGRLQKLLKVTPKLKREVLVEVL